MYFRHVPEIWENFPQLVPELMVVDGIHQDVDVEKYLEPRFEQARERLSGMPESKMPEIAAWRRAYSQMGFKPSKYRSAAEALLRRFKRENDMPRLHPLVDICNAVSLSFALPVAVFDLERVEEYMDVCYAKGTEEYISFSGEIESPAPGEVIFLDGANQVHARRWTFRQSRASTIQPETTRVLILSEGLHETAEKDVTAVIDALSEIISTIWSPPVCRATLTKESPKVNFL
jgi:DNA/RNA-binding domain of Phe-tRNA-synthetase-like protein